MKLITDGGRRTDRQTELAELVNRPLTTLSPDDRQRIKDLLAWDHAQREIVRYGHRPRR